MNTPTITMPMHVARDQLRSYRTSLHRRADAEYEAVAKGLEQLAKGTPLLNLAECFRNVPLDAKYRPRLAIARADKRIVHFRRYQNNRGQFSTAPVRGHHGRLGKNIVLTFDVPPIPESLSPYSLPDGQSVVPLVPAQVREKYPRLALDKHLILWEVDDWKELPKDPYLLRHCGGELYAILAEWDLTELERAVMAGRARA